MGSRLVSLDSRGLKGWCPAWLIAPGGWYTDQGAEVQRAVDDNQGRTLNRRVGIGRCFGEMLRSLRTIPEQVHAVFVDQAGICRAALLCAVVAASSQSVMGMQGKDVDDGGTITRPKFAGRIVRAFDFEEQYSNPLPVPRGWIRAQHDPEVPRDRPGFPIWNQTALDYESPAFSGTGTVHLPTEGGSTSLILRHGELTVFPNADYVISARVRTDGLSHARARMVATLIDRAGNDIENGERSTKLVRTRGEWQLVSVFIEGTEPEAAFVRLELQVLQPEQQPRTRRVKPFTVWTQDYTGGAWFDDVIIAQVPMIGLSTGTPGNVVTGDESPTLEMKVRDLTGDDLRASIRVYDAHGEQVDQRGDGDDNTRLGDAWTPDLPGYGWYHAVLDVYSRGVLVGRRELHFIWQPERMIEIVEAGGLGELGLKRVVPRDSVFGLRTTSLDENLLAVLPELSWMTGVKHLEMRAWDADSTAEDLAKGSVLVESIDRSVGMGVEVALSLSEVPMELADQAAIDHDSVFELLLEHEPIVLPVIGPFVDRYGQQISDWRIGIGAVEDDSAKLTEEIGGVAELLDPYVPGAVVGVGWAMDRPFESALADQPVRLLVWDDPSYPDIALNDLVEQWGDVHEGQDRLSIVHHAANDTFADGGAGSDESVWSRIGWLGRRAINAWWGGQRLDEEDIGVQIVLSDPWTVEPGRRGRVMPSPELLVWRTLVDELGGRDAVQEIDLVPGVRMLLCSGRNGSDAFNAADENRDPSHDGVIVMWLDEPMLEQSIVKLPMGLGSVELVDLFGNRRVVPLEYETELSLPVHEIEVSRTPMIVSGVNTKLVQFLSDVNLFPDRLEATSGIHQHELVVKNPWPFSIRGRVYVVEPGGYSEPGGGNVDRSWEIKPRVVNFTISAGMEERFELDVLYSPAQLAGMKDLVFDVELSADQEYGLMRVERQIELGTDLIDVDLGLKMFDGSGLVEVEAIVTNRMGDQIFVDLVAIAPKNARQESTISAIESDESGRRSFLLNNLERGDEVVIMVRMPSADVQINKSISIP